MRKDLAHFMVRAARKRHEDEPGWDPKRDGNRKGSPVATLDGAYKRAERGMRLTPKQYPDPVVAPRTYRDDYGRVVKPRPKRYYLPSARKDSRRTRV